MGDIVAKGRGEVRVYDPAAGALAVHVGESAERAAVRTKDRTHLEAAVRRKLEAQRDFANDFRARFAPSQETGGDGSNQYRKCSDARTGARAPTPAEQYVQDFGFALRTVQRWAERLIDGDFEKECGERLEKLWHIIEMELAANFSSETFEWYTPPRYLEAARAVLGEIDLDPASSETANETVKAARIFTRDDDGLRQEWLGRVFLNPPYGKTEAGDSMAAKFCNKAIAEYHAGRMTAGIVLVNSVHSQAWEAPLFDFPICLVDHRIEFVSSDGEVNPNPTFQNMFVYVGPDVREFAGVFSQFGYVMQRVG